MKGIKKNLAVSILATLLFVPAALCQAPPKDPLSAELELMGLYFGKEELKVTTSTRHPKLISQVPENMTVITADEIENMNAHTLSEVLDRVPGVFLTFAGRDFGSLTGSSSIQGSEPRHILVLIDGVRFNFLGSGESETNSIPVQIIKRIEIIKGPASASWGSSLGGIINIITKEPGNSKTPEGTFSASYGKGDSTDLRGDIYGKAGSLGYYLYAGTQHSNGLISSRGFENNTLYSKFNAPLSKDIDLSFTFGFTNAKVDQGDYPISNIRPESDNKSPFVTVSLDAALTRHVSLSLDFYRFHNDFSLNTLDYDTGELLLNADYAETKTGANARLVYEYNNHTAILGFDYERGELDQRMEAGPLYVEYGIPPLSISKPHQDKWAVYLNDTVVFNRFAITPGIRYDHDDSGGSFISPSIGLTYEIGEDSLLRCSISRGFTSPPLAYTSGGGLFLDPNPSLKVEKVWSYQAGFETKAVKYLWLKSSLFQHKMKNALVREYYAGGPPAYNDLYFNRGKVKRQGFELEIKTIPVYNFSFTAGFAYVHIKDYELSENTNSYTWNLGLVYDDNKSFRAEIFGHLIDPDQEADYASLGYNYDDFIWDINLRRKIDTGRFCTELFFTAHNIFNGVQRAFDDEKNPNQWFEAGMRFKF